MFDLPIDKILELVQGESGGLVNSILLLMIWLNVRSLKNGLNKLEVNHEKRIVDLEARVKTLEEVSA